MFAVNGLTVRVRACYVDGEEVLMKKFFGALITWPILGLIATVVGGGTATALGINLGVGEAIAIGVFALPYLFFLGISSIMTFSRKNTLSGEDVSTMVRITNFVNITTAAFLIVPTYLMISFGPPASVSFNTPTVPGIMIGALVSIGFLQDIIFSSVANRRNGGGAKKPPARRPTAKTDNVDALLAKYGD